MKIDSSLRFLNNRDEWICNFEIQILKPELVVFYKLKSLHKTMVFKPTIQCVWPCDIVKHSTNLVEKFRGQAPYIWEYYPSYFSSSSD